MNKELEALEIIGKLYLINDEQVKDWDKRDFNILKSALKRLEAIDNANPSKALECLEKLNGMEISSMPFSDEYGTQEVDLNDIRKVGSQLNTDFREYTATIKQALLKAEKEHKALEIIKKKNVAVAMLKSCGIVKAYNIIAFDEECAKDKNYARKLTQEEFDLLKEVLE